MHHEEDAQTLGGHKSGREKRGKNRKKNIPRFPFQDVSSDSREREEAARCLRPGGDFVVLCSSSSDGGGGDGVGVNEEESSHAHYVAN